MDKCYIETKIINNTIYPLTIADIYLSPKTKPNIKFPLIDNLSQLIEKQNQYLMELFS